MDNRMIINKLSLFYTNGNDKEFAARIGITPQTLSNWKSRNTIDYQLIYTKCLDVNPHWLLTGEGEMLKKEGVSDEDCEKRLEHLKRNLEDKEKIIALQDQLLHSSTPKKNTHAGVGNK